MFHGNLPPSALIPKLYAPTFTIIEREQRTGDIVSRSGKYDEIAQMSFTREIIACTISIEPYNSITPNTPNETLTLSMCKSAPYASRFGKAGVHLTVDSPDPDWSASITNLLTTDLTEHRPWWAFLCSRLGHTTVTLTSTAVSLATCYLLLTDILSSVMRLAIGAAIAMVAALFMSRRTVMEKLLPSFEVSADGHSSGSRNLGLFLTLGPVALLVGILVNRLS
jgi:hypothetical protein